MAVQPSRSDMDKDGTNEMNICQKHWDILRQKCDERGMMPLVAKDGRAAMDNTIEQLETQVTNDNWDPMMVAFWAMGIFALERCGLAAMQPDFCGMCAVQESFDSVKETPEFDPIRHKDADWWMGNCMDSMLEYARDNGLMPRVQ